MYFMYFTIKDLLSERLEQEVFRMSAWDYSTLI